MIEVCRLNQFYGGSHILWDIDLNVPSGACVCLMGRNGVGKTTLLKAIMGLVPIRSGSLSFAGQTLNGRAPAIRARLGIGYVPQGREIFPQLTVEENLRIGLMARQDGVREIPESIFELFPVLKKMLPRKGGDLSGGQQQQLAIGRALAVDPTLLILDEPTEGIQPNVVQEIGDIITRINREQQLSVLLVEQKLIFARRVAQSFYLMDKGRMVAQGRMDELQDDLISRHLAV
ncbi:MAG: urea ABC transporter ATP-binding subunit UrtE [Deltaproteobacteria bacterium]|nr:urea ABC transporter ATP-binding subunit UrtE [Deltaproteobacteria bacterium]